MIHLMSWITTVFAGIDPVTVEGWCTIFVQTSKHRRRGDLEQAVDSQLGLELIIMELMVNHKEKWLYVLG